MEVTKGYRNKPFWSSVHHPVEDAASASKASPQASDKARPREDDELLRFCGKVILFLLEIFW